MKKHLALTAAIGLALTLLACEDKDKKQTPAETQTAETEAAAETQQPSQEAAAEKVIEVVKGSFTDPRDNKTYKTVKIGEQVWMAENLNYTVEGSKCYGEGGPALEKCKYEYNDDGEVTAEKCTSYSPEPKIQANCQKYGRLYDWKTAIKACPSGWHLPSDKEWQTLVNFAGDGKTAGEKLKTKSGWNNWDGEYSHSGNGNDALGFSALPGGHFGYVFRMDSYDYDYGFVGDVGLWWSAVKNSSWEISNTNSIYNDSVEDSNDGDVSWFFRSVRCIKD